MKLRYLIILIVFVIIVGSYFIIVPIAVGTHDLFNLNTVIYFPKIITQFITQEGNGIICLDACGPCSAWGPWHILVDGECFLPNEVDPKYLTPIYMYDNFNSSLHPDDEYYKVENGDLEYLKEAQNELETSNELPIVSIYIHGKYEALVVGIDPSILDTMSRHEVKRKMQEIVNVPVYLSFGLIDE